VLAVITARVRTMPPLTAWLVGLAVGVVATWLTLLLMPFGLLLSVLVAVALILVGPRAALGGGMLLATGVWFVYIDRSMKATCDAMNTAQGFCEVIDPTTTLVLALSFVVAGALLSVYCVAKAKQQDGQAPRSGA
jgi:hypothetical protein